MKLRQIVEALRAYQAVYPDAGDLEVILEDPQGELWDITEFNVYKVQDKIVIAGKLVKDYL